MKAFPMQSLLDLSNVRMDDAGTQLGQLLASKQKRKKPSPCWNSIRDTKRAFARATGRTDPRRVEQPSAPRPTDEAIAQQRTLVDLEAANSETTEKRNG